MSQCVGLPEPGDAIRHCAFVATVVMLCLLAGDAATAQPVPVGARQDAEAGEATCERWGIADIELAGPSGGNPFVDVQLSAVFSLGDEKQTVAGFYDGDGVYRVRFMPDKLGEWHYTTHSNVGELDGKTGEFDVGRADRQQSRPGARSQHVSLRLRRRHAVQASSAQPATPGRRRTTSSKSRRSRRWPRRRSTSCGCACSRSGTRGTRTSRRCTRSKARRRTSGTSRGSIRRSSSTWRQRIAQLRDLGIEADIILFHPVRRRALGLRPHAGRGRRPLSAIRRQPAGGVPQRVVVAGQRVRLHEGEAGVGLGPA